MIKNNVENLKQVDFYSIALFSLFKMTNTPEYASLSELCYVLDKDHLLNFCEYFGGQTITVPTVKELESLIYSLLLYQYVKVDGIDYQKALELIGHESCELRQVKKQYKIICDVMSKYTFNAREPYCK